jgi:hypothetical protein
MKLSLTGLMIANIYCKKKQQVVEQLVQLSTRAISKRDYTTHKKHITKPLNLTSDENNSIKLSITGFANKTKWPSKNVNTA